MTPESLPELPVLPTQAEWKRDTAVRFQRRSEDLQKVDAALDKYDESRETYRAQRDRFIKLPNAHTFKQAVQAYDDASVAFDGAANSFGKVERAVRDWGPGHDSRDDHQAVSNLRASLRTGRERIDGGRDSVQAAMNNHGTPIPKQIHLAWLGGVPDKTVIDSAIMWAGSQQANVDVWIDSKNLLANDFKQATATLRQGQQWSSADDPAVTQRLRFWDQATPQQRDQGLDARWVASDNNVAPVLQGKRQSLQQLSDSLAGSRIRLRDVNELFNPAQAPTTPGALRPNERATLKQDYQREVTERCNFAAGADIVRLVALHDRPGLYVDTDITPPVNGLPKLIDSWNQSLTDHFNRQDPRHPLPTDRIDMPKLMDRWRDDGLSENHFPIDPTAGTAQLNGRPYRHLIAAVEEHVQLIRDGQQNDPQAPRPALDRLDALTRSIDPQGRVGNEFRDWARRTQTLGDAYTGIDPIHVRPELFKAYQQKLGGAASNNQILATSTPGVPVLADWARQVSTEISTQIATEDKKRRYYNEHDPNYKAVTISTTGPGHLTEAHSPLVATMRERFGFRNQRNPLATIPYSAFPHPSSAERNPSWMPEQVARTDPQRREGSRMQQTSSSSVAPRRADSQRAPSSSNVPSSSTSVQQQGRGGGHGRGRGRVSPRNLGQSDE